MTSWDYGSGKKNEVYAWQIGQLRLLDTYGSEISQKMMIYNTLGEFYGKCIEF